MKKTLILMFFLSVLLTAQNAIATDYFVATTGTDNSTCGAESSPCATIDYTVANKVSGGDTVIVKDGTYSGRTYITEAFADWITIRAENPYHVKLTNIAQGSEVFGIFGEGEKNIIIDGFIFSNHDPSYTCSTDREANVMFHIESASNIVLRNSILWGNDADNTCNEILKINRGSLTAYPRNIHIRGNILYGRPNSGGTDLLDSVRPGELDVYENIFFDQNVTSAHSFITIKRQAPGNLAPGGTPREDRFKIYRNVFLNWSGAGDQAFIQLGEDAPDTPQITNALIENNLFIGNSSTTIVAPFQFKDVQHIKVRANTVTGNLPCGAYGFRIGNEIAASSPDKYIDIRNNIFSDPTGTMGSRFMITYPTSLNLSTITLDHNMYWNGGNALPSSGSVPPSEDLNRIVVDPLLQTDQSGVVLPIYNETIDLFPSGETTIRREFERLVHTYGGIGESSPAKDAADASNMPGDDILGMTRDDNPDIGAFEYGASEPYIPPDDPPPPYDNDDDPVDPDDPNDPSDPSDGPIDTDDHSLITALGGCGFVSATANNADSGNGMLLLIMTLSLTCIFSNKIRNFLDT